MTRAERNQRAMAYGLCSCAAARFIGLGESRVLPTILGLVACVLWAFAMIDIRKDGTP